MENKVSNLGELNRLVVFFRKEVFYCITAYQNDDWEKHAELNPGTIRIEDVDGTVLWRRQ